MSRHKKKNYKKYLLKANRGTGFVKRQSKRVMQKITNTDDKFFCYKFLEVGDLVCDPKEDMIGVVLKKETTDGICVTYLSNTGFFVRWLYFGTRYSGTLYLSTSEFGKDTEFIDYASPNVYTFHRSIYKLKV